MTDLKIEYLPVTALKPYEYLWEYKDGDSHRKG